MVDLGIIEDNYSDEEIWNYRLSNSPYWEKNTKKYNKENSNFDPRQNEVLAIKTFDEIFSST